MREMQNTDYVAVKSQVCSFVDGRGKGIDEEIVEMVTYLNLFGIKTIASCSGHIDRGLKNFWVDFYFDAYVYGIIDDLLKECFEDKRPFAISFYYDNIKEKFICRLSPIMEEMIDKNKENKIKFEAFLKNKFIDLMDIKERQKSVTL